MFTFNIRQVKKGLRSTTSSPESCFIWASTKIYDSLRLDGVRLFCIRMRTKFGRVWFQVASIYHKCFFSIKEWIFQKYRLWWSFVFFWNVLHTRKYLRFRVSWKCIWITLSSSLLQDIKDQCQISSNWQVFVKYVSCQFFSDDGGSPGYDKIWGEMNDIIDRLCPTKY